MQIVKSLIQGILLVHSCKKAIKQLLRQLHRFPRRQSNITAERIIHQHAPEEA